ncbi:NYN domain-containing protein [Bisgaard Taxon 10/6]|uniref:NYN domain-containing protein n=1 Tax=Exercitatus varius TaxID=67857 RepID=UPI00294AA047|nr:NYN domain-containing protein [Exercitatus varius]MDG2915806.1 NYN domain-containing protein [Exercitatus varius]
MSKIKTSFNVVEEKSARLAVLIDADNASAKTIKAILEEATKFGEATVKRIYGNFVGDSGQWKSVINEYAIKPMQQFAYTKGKNATDGFMIIDAMDLLYTNRFDGFCIVSSDSDFTALAIRLKEQGVTVYGFGKEQTPEAFRNACSQFIYVENLLPELKTTNNKQTDIAQSESLNTNNKTSQINKISSVSTNNQHAESIELPIDTIRKIFEQFDSEWVVITAFGSTWKRLQVDIDPRTYGCKKFTDLVKKHPDIFDYEMRSNEEATQEQMYVKLKIEPRN